MHRRGVGFLGHVTRPLPSDGRRPPDVRSTIRCRSRPRPPCTRPTGSRPETCLRPSSRRWSSARGHSARRRHAAGATGAVDLVLVSRSRPFPYSPGPSPADQGSPMTTVRIKRENCAEKRGGSYAASDGGGAGLELRTAYRTHGPMSATWIPAASKVTRRPAAKAPSSIVVGLPPTSRYAAPIRRASRRRDSSGRLPLRPTDAVGRPRTR